MFIKDFMNLLNKEYFEIVQKSDQKFSGFLFVFLNVSFGRK